MAWNSNSKEQYEELKRLGGAINVDKTSDLWKWILRERVGFKKDGAMPELFAITVEELTELKNERLRLIPFEEFLQVAQYLHPDDYPNGISESEWNALSKGKRRTIYNGLLRQRHNA